MKRDTWVAIGVAVGLPLIAVLTFAIINAGTLPYVDSFTLWLVVFGAAVFFSLLPIFLARRKRRRK